jgi:hypothetical protein
MSEKSTISEPVPVTGMLRRIEALFTSDQPLPTSIVGIIELSCATLSAAIGLVSMAAVYGAYEAEMLINEAESGPGPLDLSWWVAPVLVALLVGVAVGGYLHTVARRQAGWWLLIAGTACLLPAAVLLERPGGPLLSSSGATALWTGYLPSPLFIPVMTVLTILLALVASVAGRSLPSTPSASGE